MTNPDDGGAPADVEEVAGDNLLDLGAEDGAGLGLGTTSTAGNGTDADPTTPSGG